MQEISNSLRQRFRVRVDPQVHPDADLLSAYIEKGLARRERTQVVQHLAACRHCREIVALSLPDVAPQPRSWFSRAWQDVVYFWARAISSLDWRSGLGWAAGMASMVAAVTLLVEEPWRSRVEPNMAHPDVISN